MVQMIVNNVRAPSGAKRYTLVTCQVRAKVSDFRQPFLPVSSTDTKEVFSPSRPRLSVISQGRAKVIVRWVVNLGPQAVPAYIKMKGAYDDKPKKAETLPCCEHPSGSADCVCAGACVGKAADR
jgi:hypothetical protein